MPEAIGVMAEPAYRDPRAANLEKARAAKAAKRAEATEPPATTAEPAADALRPGHVWARITLKGHGRIYTGKLNADGGDIPMPLIRDDDEEVEHEMQRLLRLRRESDRVVPSEGRALNQLKSELYAKARESVFADRAVDSGRCFGRGQVIQLSKRTVYGLEERGFVEVIDGN